MTEEPLNQLCQFLRGPFRAVGEAHRTNPRREASTPIRLHWTEGARRPTIRGHLVDISRAGAALITVAPPPTHAHVQLRLVGQEPTPWIEAEVLGVEQQGPSRHRVRLRFLDPCPTYFLRVAVLGPLPHEEDSGADCPAPDACADLADRPPPVPSPGSIA
jgi:hypothetical protein